MKLRLLILSSLCTILSITSAFSRSSQAAEFHFPQKNSVKNELLVLNGDWQFYFGKHLSASEMEKLSPKDVHFLNAPSNWMNLDKTPAFGIATYYAKIILDSTYARTSKDFAIRVGDITSAYTLYVNDKLIMNEGKAGKTPHTFKPGYFPHTGHFATQSDTLNVVIHASNFFYPHFSGISRSILFGKDMDVSRAQVRLIALSILALCIFGVLALFELFVFVMNREERSHLMVSALAFIFVIKMLLDSEFTIFHIFPDFSFMVGYRLWLLSFMAIPVVYQLIRLSFPDEMPRTTNRIVHTIYGMIGLAIIILPLPWVLNALMLVFYISMACIAYLIWVLATAVYHRRTDALVHFISFSIALICILYDLMMMSNPNKVNFISQVGVGVFLMTQSFLILLRFTRSHQLSLKLTNDLETANQSLEATVEKRTRELIDANLKLERLNHQKNFMLATTTHDLKNSFNILINCSHILADDASLSSEQRLYAEMIRDASQNGYRVLENILSWSKMQMTDYSGKHVVREISTLVHKELAAFQNQLDEKSLHIRIELNDQWHFVCELEQLYSIGRNLLTNAIKFSKPGGEIVVSNRLVDGKVEFRFHDDGIGMTPQMVETLFDNRIDNKRKGTNGEMGSGLGLIIVKELVENNHGTLSCFSEPGKGTDFVVQFPCVTD